MQFIGLFDNVARTKTMQAFGVFENDKVVIEHMRGCLENYKHTPQQFIDTVKNKCMEDTSQFRLICIFVPNVPCGWIDKSVKRISDGQKSCDFQEYVKSLGFVEKVDDVVTT